MEGLPRGRKPPLKLDRGFANSRLEPLILMRAYELVVPTVRRGIDVKPQLAEDGELTDREVVTRLTKGA